MTKSIYILAGGYDRHYKDFGNRLYNELLRHTSDLKILSCFFSRPTDEWETNANDWHSWFTTQFKQPFTYDYARVDSFLTQVDTANVVFFHGGDTKLLMSTLPETEKLVRHLNGKIIIGSSAGANMLSRYYWSSTKSEFGEGRGIVDKSVMVHYGAENVGGKKRTAKDWAIEKELFANKSGLPITVIPEAEFIVIEK